MRTVISIPDDTLSRATKAATALGISRSEFFKRAAEHYLDEISRESLTSEISRESLIRQINEAVERIGATDSSNRDAADAGHWRLKQNSDEW